MPESLEAWSRLTGSFANGVLRITDLLQLEQPAALAALVGRYHSTLGLDVKARCAARCVVPARSSRATCADPAGLMPLWIDTHCHPDAPEFDADRDAVPARAHPAGGSAQAAGGHRRAFRAAAPSGRAPQPCAGPASAVDRRGRARGLAGTAGRDAGGHAGRSPPGGVVGEIGTDVEPGLDAARQRHFLAEQPKLARRHDLPVRPPTVIPCSRTSRFRPTR